MNFLKNNIVGLIAIVIALFAFGVRSGAISFGGVTTGTAFPHGISIGNPAVLGVNPTNMSKFMFGTCPLIASNYTVAASTTVAMDCAITGVTSVDGVFGQFATSTQIGQGGWAIRGASASTTPGFITFSVVNSTGASNTIPASIASTTKYIVLGAQ